jgi:hypothetical protein
MLDSDGYFTQTFDIAMIPISKDDRVLGILFLTWDVNIFFSPVMWFVHPLSMIQLVPQMHKPAR